jgi:hypothetical protein
MSYNVAIARPPISANDDVAWTWVGTATQTEDAAPPRVFHELIDRLTARHPCICDLDDDVVDDLGVWSDGPLRDNIMLEAPVLGIVYSRVDDVLLS